MNPNITRLNRIAKKKSRMIVGLMSGTSLDGLDIALCRISDSGRSTKVNLLEFQTIPYSKEFRDEVLNIFARREIDFQALCELNASIGLLHARMVKNSLKKWKVDASKIDLIASHGQTMFHSPKAITPGASINSTLQIGDGDHLAANTGIITFSDFRQKHIAGGGEGAPLAVYGDYLLFSKRGENRIMLNMGGIGNFTFLPASCNASEVFVTDTGPANTLIDQTIRKFYPGQTYDRNSEIAKNGTYDPKLVKQLLSHSFFNLPFPKTVGPELFNMEFVEKACTAINLQHIAPNDLVATLTRFSSESIARAIKRMISGKMKFKIYLSGGGAHNPLMMTWIKELLPEIEFFNMSKLGISGDAKEAILFAVLANEAVAGGKVNFGKRTNVPSVSMGKVSFPD